MAIRIAFAILTSALLATSSQSQVASQTGGRTSFPETTRPWRVATEDRILGRLTGGSGSSKTRTLASKGGFAEQFNGQSHPEYFLDYELFDFLIAGLQADQPVGRNLRALYEPQVLAAGFDSSFWEKLAAVSAPYLRLSQPAHKHGSVGNYTTFNNRQLWVPVSKEVCRARFGALTAARREFGAEAFDRFLYTGIARTAKHSRTGTTTPSERAQQLRYIAGGCQ